MLALLLPALWWLVSTDHLGYNAILATGREWVGGDIPSAPWAIRSLGTGSVEVTGGTGRYWAATSGDATGPATFVLDKGHGLADFTRDPARATRSYFATTSPLGMALDLAEFGLTFATGNIAGGLAGEYARRAGLRGLAPWVNAWRLGVGRSVILADGTTLSPLSQADTAVVDRWGDDVPWQTAPNRSAAMRTRAPVK